MISVIQAEGKSQEGKMKRNLLYFIPFLLLYFCTNPLFCSEFKIEDIKAEIAKHFEQPQGGIKVKRQIESNSQLATLGNDFFKENFLYIDYISKQSMKFMEQILYTFEMYLISKGNEISNFDEKSKEEISIHDLKATGVRFFFPVEVTEDGRIGTRICVTGEGFQDYEKRNIALEAFTFDTIFNEIRKEDSYILPKVEEYNRIANKLKLSNIKEDLLKRAQGFMWALFYIDDNLEEILFDSYLDKKEYLPFKITR